jgi:ribosomal protein L11 methyltransferase
MNVDKPCPNAAIPDLKPAMTDTFSPALAACLTLEEARALKLSNLMAELLPADEVAVSVFEADEAAKLWTVEFVFERAPDEASFRALIADQAGADAGRDLAFETLQTRDWVAASLAGLAPVSAGRFMLHGAHDRARVPAHRIGIEIEAALAFGTGHHGTTRGCLIAFDDLCKRRRPKRILDIGTGTGVLAIAAARRLHHAVLGSDIDAVAIRVARDNARRNRAGSYVRLFTAAGADAGRFRQSGPFDLIFANILAPPLRRMARPVAALLAPESRIVLSGLLPDHANAVIAAYRAQGLRLERRYLFAGWVTLVMHKG